MGDEGKKHKKTERVRVHCRVRPLNEEDIRMYGRDVIIDAIEPSKGTISLKREFDRKSFQFDAIFEGTSTQKEIYMKIGEPVVNSILQGYNGTIFAYGQTGTGKTFTMIGASGENKGVIPRSMHHIFTSIQACTTHSFSVKIGFLQLYMEMLQDLLNPDAEKMIRIREDPDEGVYLTGVSWNSVVNVKQCMDLLNAGDRNRSTAFTSMNAHSSRSHAVYMVKLEKRVKYNPEQLEELEKKGETPDQSMTKSTLYLVDLAGSERVKKSRASGNRLDEAKNINLALLALGNCIQALSDKKAKYVPFRDSKLTRLLEDSLGGNSKTSLIVTIGPSSGHIQETLSALQFGQRAMKIENRPELNIKVDYRALCAQLQAELDKINDGNNMHDIATDKYLEEINSLKSQIDKLLAEREQMEALLEEYRKGHNDLTQFEELKKIEIQKIQSAWKQRMDKKDAENKKFLEDIDKHMVEQEEENKALKSANVELNSNKKKITQELKRVQEELEKEKGDRQLRASQLITEIDDLKDKLNSEREKTQELQHQIQGLEEIKQRSEGNIQELMENIEFQKAKSVQEAEELAKEIQKNQAIVEKLKKQITVNANEFQEAKDKIEAKWQSTLINKEKILNQRILELEGNVNSLNLQLSQNERENSGLKEDIKVEKENVRLQAEKCEKLKENFEERISRISFELTKAEKTLVETSEKLAKVSQDYEEEKKSHSDDLLSLNQDLRTSIKKNGKLIKAYKELELANEKIKKESEEKLNAKSEEFMKSRQLFEKEKGEFLKELEDAHEQVNSLNKDRTKLIAKIESLSKKTSSIVKLKDKLSNEAEIKQQAYKAVAEQRELLEEEVEMNRKLILDLQAAVKNKESANEELKVAVLSLSNECHNKECEIEAKFKMISDMEKKNLEKEAKISEYKESLKQLSGDHERNKATHAKLLEDFNKLTVEKSEIVKESKSLKDNLEKQLKITEILSDDYKNLEIELKGNISSLSQQKDQQAAKLKKLTEDYKSLEIAHSTSKSESKTKSNEILFLKDALTKYSTSFHSSLRLLQDKLLKQLDSLSSTLSKSQWSISFFINKLKESLKTKTFQLEKLQNTYKKESALIAESHSKELRDMKDSMKETIENLNEKHLQEIQDLQELQAYNKNFYEETLNAMVKSKQKEIEQLSKENSDLRMEFEISMERQKNHATAMKNHQLELIEEVQKSHQQEIEALYIENENRLKRKDAEIAESKKRIKEVTETKGEVNQELEDLKLLVEKLREVGKKAEAEQRKLEMGKNRVEEELKITVKKLEFEKNRAGEADSNVTELNDKINGLASEKYRIAQEIKEVKIYSKRLEEEKIKLLEDKEVLEAEVIELKKSLEKNYQKSTAEVISQAKIKDLSETIEELQEANQHALAENTKLVQDYLSLKTISAKSQQNCNEYISALIIEKLLLSLELSSAIDSAVALKQQTSAISEALSGSHDLLVYLKTFLKDHKKGENLFEFLSLFANFYSKVAEKLPVENDSIQVYYLSKIVHEKYISSSKILAIKSQKTSKPYDKLLTEIEKELGISEQSKSDNPQEIMAKKAKEAEKNIKSVVFSLMEHILFVVDLQSTPSSKIKLALEDQRRQIEPLFPLSQLKTLEIIGIPKKPSPKSAFPELLQISELKNLCNHLSSILSMISAMYTCILSRNILLEHIADDQADFISMLISNIKLAPGYKPSKFSISQKGIFGIDKLIAQNAALTIQRFFRKNKRKQKKKQEFIQEYNLQKIEEEQRRLHNTLMQINSKTGLHLMKNHFREINSLFTTMCRKFVKPQTDLNKF